MPQPERQMPLSVPQSGCLWSKFFLLSGNITPEGAQPTGKLSPRTAHSSKTSWQPNRMTKDQQRVVSSEQYRGEPVSKISSGKSFHSKRTNTTDDDLLLLLLLRLPQYNYKYCPYTIIVIILSTATPTTATAITAVVTIFTTTGTVFIVIIHKVRNSEVSQTAWRSHFKELLSVCVCVCQQMSYFSSKHLDSQASGFT